MSCEFPSAGPRRRRYRPIRLFGQPWRPDPRRCRRPRAIRRRGPTLGRASNLREVSCPRIRADLDRVRDIRLKVRTKYCHLSEHAVTQLARSSAIGTTGRRSTPSQTGYEHVHWELLISNGVTGPPPMTAGCFDSKQSDPTDQLCPELPREVLTLSAAPGTRMLRPRRCAPGERVKGMYRGSWAAALS